jgi:hypothetical protein
MAFDLQNDYFQIDFNGGDGNSYTLTFVPAYHLDTTGKNREDFLPNQIFPEIKGSVSYPDNVPFGFPTAHSLELKINLANFDGDYEAVATQIVKGRSATQRTVNGRGMYIPNLWLLECTAINFSKTYAQLPSEQDIDISKGKAEYSIKLIGIEKAIFERLNIEDLDLDSITPDYTVSNVNNVANIVWDIGYSIDGGSNYRFLGEEPRNEMKLYKNSTIFNQINSKATDISDAFRRGILNNINTNISISDIDSIWTFYEQDITTNHDKSATSVNFANLMLIGGVLDGEGNYNDGFFDVTKNGFYSYNNVWSFLRQFCQNFMLKAKWGTTAGKNLTLNFYPALDSISSAEDVADLDPKEFKLTPTENYISEATSFTLGTGSDDKGEYKAVSEYGSLDGTSEDSEVFLHNYNFKFVEGIEAGKNDSSPAKFIGTPSELRKKQNININSYYYYKSISGRYYWKCHEDCDLDIGGGNATISGDTTYQSFNYADNTYTSINDRDTNIISDLTDEETFNSFYSYLKNPLWAAALYIDIANRQPYYGVSYNRVQGAKAILGNTNQGVLTAKLGYQIDSSTNLDLSKLGEAFTIDLGTVSSVPSLGEFSGDLILTSIEYDFISGDIECDFFMRGDAGA